jgi:tetratricopeptide (TPR) repeat protein
MVRDGATDEAHRMYKRAIDGFEKRRGKNHPDTFTAVHKLAELLHKLGLNEDAKIMLSRAVLGREKLFGDDHPDTIASSAAFANVLSHIGHNEEADLYYQKIYAIYVKKHGKLHHKSVEVMKGIIENFMDSKAFDRAEPLCRTHLGILEDHASRGGFGIIDDRLHTQFRLDAITALATCLMELDRLEEAERMFEKGWVETKAVRGADHIEYLAAQRYLGKLFVKQGRAYDAQVIS